MSEQAALQKVYNVMGAERGGEIVRQTLRQIGRASLATADDRLLFGDALIKRGGVLESIGRAIKIQAILHGAREA